MHFEEIPRWRCTGPSDPLYLEVKTQEGNSVLTQTTPGYRLSLAKASCKFLILILMDAETLSVNEIADVAKPSIKVSN